MSARPGITTLDDVRDRCCITDAGCWIWRYAHNGAPKPIPQAWFPQERAIVPVTIVVHILQRGRRPAKAMHWRPKCGESSCVNPEHCGYISHSTLVKRAGRANPKLHVYRATVARRARSALCAQEVNEIRESTGTLEEVASLYGVSRSTVSRIRRGNSWKPLASPVASVFTLGSIP